MRRQFLIAHDLLFAEFKSGKASKRIRVFKLRTGNKVFLILRVSGRERIENLPDQEANLRKAVAKSGAIVVGVFPIQCPGFDPSWIREAVKEARKAGATVLLAETTDRFVRNEVFRAGYKGLQDYQATDEQLAKFVEYADGLLLMTHLHPDASPSEVRSYQRKRGQRYKRNRGGRPKNRTAGYMVRRWEEKIGLVLFLHRQGWSLNRIARKPMVGKVPRSTIYDWIKKYA